MMDRARGFPHVMGSQAQLAEGFPALLPPGPKGRGPKKFQILTEENVKHTLTTFLLGGAVLLGGCATKTYVKNTVQPVQAKVDQVGAKGDETRRQLESDETKLSATTEKADAADSRATDALHNADTASKRADQVRTDLRNELSETVANLDDYKPVGDATVHFGFNSDKLTQEDTDDLDKLVTDSMNTVKHYFIAVEGFTDRVGPAEYNIELSRRRAQAVQNYLVAQHNIPVYRIQIVGLGKLKPVDEGKKRDAMAKNRRVEVTLFSSDAALAGMEKPSTQGQNPQPQQ